MAKSKKRRETASTDQSLVPPDARASDRGSDIGEDARERIAERAYELYLARGAADGGDFDDWITAERELIGSNAQGSDRHE